MEAKTTMVADSDGGGQQADDPLLQADADNELSTVTVVECEDGILSLIHISEPTRPY